MGLSFPECFWAKVDKTDSCWIFTGAILRNGYGYAWNGKRVQVTHRLAYELVVGAIPEGLVLDHLCRTPACVNPEHLEPVTQAENVRRGDMAKVQRERREGQTHCLRGHLLAGNDLYVDKRGRRSCRACHRVADRNRKRAKREKARSAA